MKKLLTLIIPTYNMEAYLSNCLDSLLIDTALLSQLEVLVIIDGGTDRSKEIAQTYADRYPESFRVIVKDNGNYGSCINRGISEAKGTYVKVLDADDMFGKSAFERFLPQLQEIDADMVINDYATRNMANNQRCDYRYQLPHPEIFTLDSFVSQQQTDLMMHAVTYRTDMLRKMNYCQSEGISYTDQEWIFLPVTQANRLWYFPEILYLYRIGRDGQTIDINVWVKHANDEIMGLKRMTTDYIRLKDKATSAGLKHLESRLQKRIESAYRHIFIRSIDAVDCALISDLDTYLHQQLPQFYKQVEHTTTYHGLNVIGLWRRWPRLYKIYIFIRKTASSFR